MFNASFNTYVEWATSDCLTNERIIFGQTIYQPNLKTIIISVSGTSIPDNIWKSIEKMSQLAFEEKQFKLILFIMMAMNI